MNKTQISAEIVGHSLSPQGDELISVLATFPRIILSEVNTHRMLSKNTSSSRAIPFNKMVQAIQENPFIPIAWQKEHKGMQGTEYWTEEDEVRIDIGNEFEYIEDIQPITEEFKIRWLEARDKAVNIAIGMNDLGLTKQLCNRLLEPFMWTTMLITGSKEGWDNFFNLRCPQYFTPVAGEGFYAKSWKELQSWHSNPENEDLLLRHQNDTLFKLQHNKGQAEIHMMDLAEKIYDAVNESTPKQLQPGEWHIPFENKMDIPSEDYIKITGKVILKSEDFTKIKVKTSVAMAARTSYTIVGEEKEIDYQKMIDLHDRLLAQDPPHSSPFEHCARAMSNDEWSRYIKGNHNGDFDFGIGAEGWCNNFKGFIPYRYLVDNSLSL